MAKQSLKNVFFFDGCGDITVVNCHFIDCHSTLTSGGGILVEQDCTIVLHGCIFYDCVSEANGGAVAIAKLIKFDEDSDPSHDQTKHLDYRYNCVDNCIAKNERAFGSSLLIGAIETSILYSSTKFDMHEKYYKSWGASYDLVGENIKTTYTNITGGYSEYCGGIEYRQTSFAIFKFNTISRIVGKYAVAFNIDYHEDCNISFCNILENEIVYFNEAYNPSAFIFYRYSDITIKHFYFAHNDCDGRSLIAASVFIRGYQYWNIYLEDCYGLKYDEYNTDYSYLYLEHCDFECSTLQSLPLDHLNLSSCEGIVTPEIFHITNTFTETPKFTQSEQFSMSSKFTKSSSFTSSLHFCQSKIFTPSETFMQSSFFSPSEIFTGSQVFSKSKSLKATPSASSENRVISNMKSLSPSLMYVKSVSMSCSLYVTQVESYTFNEELGDYSKVFITTSYTQAVPYLIHFYSETLVETVFFMEIEEKKQKFSPEQLIGIVCGSVGGFFAIVGSIFIVQRHRITKNDIDSLDYSDSEDEVTIHRRQMTSVAEGTEGAKETQVSFDVSKLNNADLDNWL